MARLNVYVSDDLARAAREADLNVSALTQAALVAALAPRATDAWLEGLPMKRQGVSHTEAMRALEEAREELSD